VEPELALVKYKKLVGGGVMKIVNQSVAPALACLGYTEEERERIRAHIEEKGTIEGAPGLRPEHLPVFDCSFTPAAGARSISYRGHLRMMAAVQPFLSGAISKTINMPTEVTAEEIAGAYVEAWKLGLKAVALYRDGSKRTQPLSTTRDGGTAGVREARRRRLPDERQAITHKFSIGGHEGYITVGMYEDGSPGEIFVVMSKEGSVVSGLMDGFATAISLALQYGVPLKVLASKFSHTRFEPSGFTQNPEIPIAKSILDYLFRWLASRFLSDEEQALIGVHRTEGEEGETGSLARAPKVKEGSGVSAGVAAGFRLQEDAPPCHECGAIMVRGGACYKCLNCGATSGCS
jgi:ribonucleoside-diphosphate reductase alpha chain